MGAGESEKVSKIEPISGNHRWRFIAEVGGGGGQGTLSALVHLRKLSPGGIFRGEGRGGHALCLYVSNCLGWGGKERKLGGASAMGQPGEGVIS